MSNKIDLIMSSVQQFCREGYLLPKERQTLFDLADLHGIDKTELESVLNQELEKVRKSRLENLYKAAKQPDAALSEKPDFFQQSRRQFPDMVRIGTLKLKLNPSVTAPAFVPLKNLTGLCVIHDNRTEMACNVIQNVAVRILLSAPRGLAQVTIIDCNSMGADYIGLSGIDSHLLRLVDEEKQIQPFFQTVSRDAASFNFNGLGNSFADIAEYNRTNRSKARPYQLVILSGLQAMDKNILPEIKKVVKLAQKTGVFFLFAIDAKELRQNPELLDVFKTRPDVSHSLCVIDTVNHKLEAEASDEVEFFNNAFDFELEEELSFTANTIQQMNHEYDPNTYPITTVKEDSGDFCIESINLNVGKTVGKDKAYVVALRQRQDNVLAVAKDKKVLQDVAAGMLHHTVLTYKRSELQYLFFNLDFVPDTLASQNIIANIHSDKLSYLLDIMRQVKAEMESRETLFGKAGVDDYEAFRNAEEQPLPRWMCFLNGIEALLDSENMGDIETVMLLDQLTGEAGKYGIHFVLLGKPSANLLKLNLSEHVRYKWLNMLEEDEAMLVGIVPSQEDLLHQSQPGNSLAFDGQLNVYARLSFATTDEAIVKEIVSAFTPVELVDRPIALVDKNGLWPIAYKGINAETIAEACLADAIPIGIPRGYETQFACIGQGHALIVGDDADSEMSILRSVYATLKRTGRLASLSVFDASGSYPLGMPGMPGLSVHSHFETLPVAGNGVVCVLNADALDGSFVNVMESLTSKVRQSQAQMLLFGKSDTFVNELGLASSDFNVKIALNNASDGFISPVYFYGNDELSAPKTSLEALMEQVDASGNMAIHGIWLFNY